VTPTTAFKIGEKSSNPLQMYLSDVYTLPANFAGLCGLSLPCGFSKAGLPIAMHIMGKSFPEYDLLSLGYEFE
jgi:aspartyl-tRNA(Asn)/glutamyl-tRNA(Gln) amidotransferase subunit A